MITYEIPVLIGAENTDDGPLIKTHDSGVNLRVKLLRMKRVSSWREIPEPYIIPEGTTAVFRAKNPDGTKTVVDATPEPGKNTVFCELPPEALPTKGMCKAEIVLYSTAGERLTSATFCYRVEAECVCDDDPESEDYVEVFKELREEMKNSALPSDTEQIAMLAEADMLPAVHDADGAILTDENGNVILRY